MSLRVRPPVPFLSLPSGLLGGPGDGDAARGFLGGTGECQ